MSKRVRFQKTDTTQLPLSDGDWVEVRVRLSGAERRKMSARAFSSMRATSSNPEIGVDFAALGLSRIKAYLVDWSFDDAAGKRVPCTEAAIDALDEETLVEIDEALDKHCEKVEAESKALSGVAASSPGSPAAGTSVGVGSNTTEPQST